MLNEILKILENNAKATPAQIAAMTGLKEAEVKKQITKAEKDRLILKYKTVVNWDKVNEGEVWALIEVKIMPQRDVGFDAIAERIYKFPQARTVYLVSGTYDLLVQVTGKNIHEIANFVYEKLATIEGVQGTVSHFGLKRYKEDGEVLAGIDDSKRQRVIL